MTAVNKTLCHFLNNALISFKFGVRDLAGMMITNSKREKFCDIENNFSMANLMKDYKSVDSLELYTQK
jgi:hypothetical protein